MASDEVPPWMREAAEAAQQYFEQVRDELRSGLPAMRAAVEFVEQARRAQLAQIQIGSALQEIAQVALAMDAGMAQLRAAVEQQVAARHHYATAALTVRPVMVADAEVIRVAERESVTVLEERNRVPGLTTERLVFALVLVWLIAVALPAAQLKLPAEVQAYLDSLYGTASIALAITWRMNDNRRR